MAKKQTLDQIERSLKRLHSRLKRTVNAIDKQERAKRRMAKADAEDGAKYAPLPKPKPPEPEAAHLEVPVFLRRETLGESCDRIVSELIQS